MNSRERFLEILDFNTSIRTLDWEVSYWIGTVRKWYSEGLVKKKGIDEKYGFGDVIAGPGIVWPLGGFPKDSDIENQLDFDTGLEVVDINFFMCPPFEEKVIEETNDNILVRDADGVKRLKKRDSSTIAKIVSGPVQNDKDWDILKEERFQLRFNGRKPENWDDLKKRYKNRDFPLSISYYPLGFFGILRSLFGEPQIYYIYYDNPELIHKINSYLCDLWINLFSEILLEVDVDCAFFWEDMAGRQGSLISKEMFKEFMTPYYKKITDFLNSKGIKHMIVDTDGNVDELIPLFIECGVNGMFPFEVQAGCDIVKIRKKYPEFLIMGGLDKRVLAQSKEKIDIELKEKLPYMLKMGGFIPYADHAIPPDVSWENFKYYRYRIKEYIGKEIKD